MSETFAELLRREMDRRLLTQEGLAQAAQISVRSVQRYLQGGRPHVYNAAMIAANLGLDRSRVAAAIAATERDDRE